MAEEQRGEGHHSACGPGERERLRLPFVTFYFLNEIYDLYRSFRFHIRVKFKR